MRILFITAHKYLPQMRGGLQSSTHELCLALMQRGHKVAVLAGLMPDGPFALKCRVKMKFNQLAGCQVARETGLSYPVWYAWHPWEAVARVTAKEKPDLIIVLQYQSVRMALEALKTGIPILMQMADVEFHQHGGAFEALGNVPCVANSHFTAKKYRDAYGVCPTVIYPLVNPARYKTTITKANITFINPHPMKGSHIAIEVARLCPEIPFAFYEAWPLSPEERAELSHKLAKLPNVALHPPQQDMRKVYAQCGVLLAPSVCEEAYGRVATEAQINGIPVIGSTRGGLPEAIGPGGIQLDPDQPVGDWAEATRRLWRDEARYAALSAAALQHAQRKEINFDHQLAAWERVITGNR